MNTIIAYILVIATNTRGGTNYDVTEFTSKGKCESAKAAVMEAVDSRVTNIQPRYIECKPLPE